MPLVTFGSVGFGASSSTKEVLDDLLDNLIVYVLRVITEMYTLMDCEGHFGMRIVYQKIQHPYHGSTIPVLLPRFSSIIIR